MKELYDTIEAIRQVPATEQGLEQMRNLFCHGLTLVAEEFNRRNVIPSEQQLGAAASAAKAAPSPQIFKGKKKSGD